MGLIYKLFKNYTFDYDGIPLHNNILGILKDKTMDDKFPLIITKFAFCSSILLLVENLVWK